ncbi:MAG TPA: ATP-binding protein [Acidimicrobiia bacterium]|nr:ATP-binding protein [Acidimicrobiia bacterium]
MRVDAGMAGLVTTATHDPGDGDDAGEQRGSGSRLRLVETVEPAATGAGADSAFELARELHDARRVETVGRFALSIAHDFNSLCSALIYFAEVATSCVRSGDDPSAVIGHIAETAQSASELSRQILSFTRDQVTEPIRLSLDSAVNELTPLLRCLAGPERDLEISTDAPGATTRIAPSHLRQILLNLLVNAYDATPPGGRITIETERIADGSARGPAAFVALRVHDTGSGMDPRTLARCFEPFFTTKGMGRGTGIGLATVRDIVELYGGRIDATSTPGSGSTFTVYLPAA